VDFYQEHPSEVKDSTMRFDHEADAFYREILQRIPRCWKTAAQVALFSSFRSCPCYHDPVKLKNVKKLENQHAS